MSGQGSFWQMVVVVFLSCGWMGPASAVTLDMVVVGDPGNTADTTGYGAVADAFQIGKYEVTIGQYAEFLNAVAATDTYFLYNTNMGSNLNIAGITRSGAPGSYSYAVTGPSGSTPAGADSPGNRPITYVSWFDAARFANWMSNGQPTGAQTTATTENGAYFVNSATSGTAPAKNATNPNTSAAPSFYIPTESEWYKAAYFSPEKGGAGVPGYFDFATQSDTAPGNVIGSGANQANYLSSPDFFYSVTQSGGYSGSQNYLTNVGAFTSSESFYGTFDQSGNVREWNDLDGIAGSFRGLRGGSGFSSDATELASSDGFTSAASNAGSSFGFRLASPVAVPEPSTWVMGLAGLACAAWGAVRRRKRSLVEVGAEGSQLMTTRRNFCQRVSVAVVLMSCGWMNLAQAITLDMVTVGSPGNAHDTTGYGAVPTSFQIMKFEFTNSQYAEFLNKVDPQGTNPNAVYNGNMGSDVRGGITNTGTTDGSRYAVKPNMGNKPVIWVSWFDAARVSNWLHNGAQAYATSDSTASAPQNTGAYTVGTNTSGTAPAKNVGAQYWVPTENEWYKAAYFEQAQFEGLYWDYTTATDTPLTSVTANPNGDGAGSLVSNTANFGSTADWNSQNGNVTTVGTNGRPSAYGTFDQTGNVWEWTDLSGLAGLLRGLRGGSYDASGASNLTSALRSESEPSIHDDSIGFRLASPVAVPEPSTWVMGLAGLACAAWGAVRRRKRSLVEVGAEGSQLMTTRRNFCQRVSVAVVLMSCGWMNLAQAITLDMVTVGSPGNAHDTTGYGGVSYEFQIGKYEVTIGQYAEFLNAVAKSDMYSLYNTSMGLDLSIAGIARTGVTGSYAYSVIHNGGLSTSRPITYVSWFDAARFANWMSNGQPTGPQSATTTENGAYNLNGATIGARLREMR